MWRTMDLPPELLDRTQRFASSLIPSPLINPLSPFRSLSRHRKQVGSSPSLSTGYVPLKIITAPGA